MKNEDIGIYLHIPFCKKKCPYCDFYSVRNENLIKEYINRLCLEIINWGSKCKKKVNTIYFGGGTPSLLNTLQIKSILECIYENFKVCKNSEITVEVNPADYSYDCYKELRNLKINRISLGMQSLFDEDLSFLGRRHTSKDVFNSLRSIKKSGFKNVSVDLILGIPGQTNKKLTQIFNFLKKENITHISTYMLKIEENTIFFKNKENLNLPNEDSVCDLYLHTCSELKKYGYSQYEISNFSKKGFESKHNLKYWNLKDYLGIGPGAHSFFENRRFFYEKNTEKFLIFEEESVNFKQEYLMLKLRLSRGIQNVEFKKMFGRNAFENILKKSKKYVQSGHLCIDKNRIKLTNSGFLISNSIITDLI